VSELTKEQRIDIAMLRDLAKARGLAEHRAAFERIAAALNAQEERLPPTMTPEEAREFQRWEGMNGAIAYQLIERHADGWADVGVMMDAWLEANALNQQAGVVEDEAAVERLAAHLYRRIYGNFAFAHASARKKSEMRDEARAAIAAVKEKGRG
jgi:hypothetical protein